MFEDEKAKAQNPLPREILVSSRQFDDGSRPCVEKQPVIGTVFALGTLLHVSIPITAVGAVVVILAGGSGVAATKVACKVLGKAAGDFVYEFQKEHRLPIATVTEIKIMEGQQNDEKGAARKFSQIRVTFDGTRDVLKIVSSGDEFRGIKTGDKVILCDRDALFYRSFRSM